MAQEILRNSFSKKLWRRDLRDSFSQKLWRRKALRIVFHRNCGTNCGAGSSERQFFAEIVARGFERQFFARIVAQGCSERQCFVEIVTQIVAQGVLRDSFSQKL